MKRLSRTGAASSLALLLLSLCGPTHAIEGDYKAEPGAPEPKNSGVSIWTTNVAGFRKAHAVGEYTKKWDLSDLPHYVPTEQLTGTIRIWGNSYLVDGHLGDYWVEAFRKFQPGLKLEYHMPTGAIAVAALATGVADLGMFYKATLTDNLVFEQVYHHPVTEIKAATGSMNVYGWGPAGIIVVNKDNPLTQISMKQLDGVFGGSRTGGYVGSVWHTEYPYTRGADENIRTWGQLGLGGEWADRKIHVGGQNLSSGAMREFDNKVLRGSMQFVEDYTAVTNYTTPEGKMNSWSLQAQRIIARDRYSMFYVSPLSLSPDMKELAIQAYDGGPYVKRSLDSLRDHSYPLTNYIHFYLDHEPGKPVDPKVKEFLRFVLSREGQEEVQHEARYIPLTAQMVREELKKLD
jgi:phosphate transport system substrate-binding protein